jgi:competence protein ComEC
MGWRCPTGLATAAALVLGSTLGPRGLPGISAAAALGMAALLARRRLRHGAPAVAASVAAITALGAGAGALRSAGARPARPPYLAEATVAGQVAGWEPRGHGVLVTVRAFRIGALHPDPPVLLTVFGDASWGRAPAARWVRLQGRLVPTRNGTVPGAWMNRGVGGRLIPGRGARPEWGPGRPPAMAVRRARLTRRVREVLRGFPARLAEAMLLGRGSALSPAERAVFRRCGASHLVAVSGLHVGLLAGLAALLLAGAPAPIRLAVVMAVAWGYAAVAGWSPSAVRAATLVTLVTAGALARRPRPASAWLALALPWLVWARPELVGSVSFLLSVGAVAGILLAVEVVRPPTGLRGALAGPVAAGLGAQWGTLPAALSAFGTISPCALLPNLVAIPLAGLFLPAVLLTLTGVPGLGPAARDAAMLAGAAIGNALGFAASHLPDVRGWPPPEAWATATLVLVPVAWFSSPRSARRRRRWRWGALAGALVAAAACLWPRSPEPGPWAAFLDVGQGDAAVFRFAEGSVWAVDVGDDRGPGDAARNAILPFLRHQGIRRVDGLVLSHRHRDHVGALGPFLDGMPVHWVFDAGYGSRRGTAGRVDSVLAAHGAVACLAAAGDTLFHVGKALIVAVHPPRGDPAGPVPGGDLNEVSLMVRVSEGDFSVFFAGDGGFPAEAACLARGDTLGARVLKVGHHGSRWASSAAFLRAVHPRYAVISCGVGNRYGHPSAEALARLAAARARVLRTDRDGTVIVRRRGRGRLAVSTHPPRAP